MPSREYQVEAESILPEGFWPGEVVEAESRSELERLMLDAAAVVDRIGGVFTIMALREELADANGEPSGLFVTTGFKGKWESFAPARRAPKPAPAPQEPVAAPQEPPEAEAYPEAESELSEPQGDAEAAVDDFGPDAERALEKV